MAGCVAQQLTDRGRRRRRPQPRLVAVPAVQHPQLVPRRDDRGDLVVEPDPPRSTSCSAATLAIALVIDASRNVASTSREASSLAVPAAARPRVPSRSTATAAAPGTAPPATASSSTPCIDAVNSSRISPPQPWRRVTLPRTSGARRPTRWYRRRGTDATMSTNDRCELSAKLVRLVKRRISLPRAPPTRLERAGGVLDAILQSRPPVEDDPWNPRRQPFGGDPPGPPIDGTRIARLAGRLAAPTTGARR